MHESKHIGKESKGNYYAHGLKYYRGIFRLILQKLIYQSSSYDSTEILYIKVYIFCYILIIVVDNLSNFHFQHWSSAVHAKEPGAHRRLMIALHLLTLLAHISLDGVSKK